MFYAEAGAAVDLRGKASDRKKDRMFGRSALLEAAYQGHGDIVRSLLAAGADKEARDTLGRTGKRGGDAEVIKVMLGQLLCLCD